MRHSGKGYILGVILESFIWKGMNADVDAHVAALIRGCLHCMVTRTSQKITRPLSKALHGGRPNEVVTAL